MTDAPTRRPGPLEQIASTTIASTLAVVAGVRRGKAVHPTGAVFDARLVVGGAVESPAARLLSCPGEHRAVVRFSRSIGLPRPLPDLLGMAVRVLDAYGSDRHQDLMMISSIDLPVLHHIFVPARNVWQRPYTSALPFRCGGELVLIGAMPRLEGSEPEGSDELERAEAAAASGRLSFGLAVARLNGRFRPVAELTLGKRLDAEADALRFNPWNTGADLQPAGWLNAARRQSYSRSQAAWRRTQVHGGQRQDDADLLVSQRRSHVGPSEASGAAVMPPPPDL